MRAGDPSTTAAAIERVACAGCSRSRAVYAGHPPRRWRLHAGFAFCDRRRCRELLARARTTALGEATSDLARG